MSCSINNGRDLVDSYGKRRRRSAGSETNDNNDVLSDEYFTVFSSTSKNATNTDYQTNNKPEGEDDENDEDPAENVHEIYQVIKQLNYSIFYLRYYSFCKINLLYTVLNLPSRVYRSLPP